jgi:hypothetical protein
MFKTALMQGNRYQTEPNGKVRRKKLEEICRVLYVGYVRVLKATFYTA